MAAFTPAHSATWLQFVSTPPQLVPAWKWGGKLHTLSASLTFTGAGVGTAKMFRLPAGKVRVYPDLSWIWCPDAATNSDLHIGYAAYTQEDGTAGPADDNAFMDNVDIGGGDKAQAWTLPAVGYLDLNSRNGIDIEVMFDTANTAAAGEMFVVCTYSTVQ